jgi:predicted transcriptional regulator
MKNGNNTGSAVEQKLDTIIDLLQHLLVLELANRGVSQEKIGKHIHVAKAAVVEMMDGIKKESRANA